MTTLLSTDLPDDLGFTSDHDLLRSTARRILADACPMSAVRGLVGDPIGFDPGLHRLLAEHGFTGVLVPEDHGGASLGYLAAALVLEETGRCLLPGPFFASVLAGVAIDRSASAAQKARWLAPLAAGTRVATVALTEPGGSWEPAHVAATARVTPEGWQLSGDKTHVLFASAADWMVAPFLVDPGPGETLALFVVDLRAPGVRVLDEVPVDSTRRMARVTLDGAVVDAGARLEGGTLAAWRDTHVRGQALLAAEMVGAAAAMLGRTRDYAIERVQFGRPIGSFQAVKHPLVDVLIAVERARSLTLGAAAALDAATPGAEILARMAKAAATDALHLAADRGVQLHGGHGFTWDCDAHFFMKRALWSAATLGDARHHRRHLAAQLRGT